MKYFCLQPKLFFKLYPLKVFIISIPKMKNNPIKEGDIGKRLEKMEICKESKAIAEYDQESL